MKVLGSYPYHPDGVVVGLQEHGILFLEVD
jgi:hypothetical protein